MKKKSQIITILVCSILLGCKQVKEQKSTQKIEQARPNIILIMADQHRSDATSLKNKNVITPNLNALAKDGAWFKNGYSSVPSCTPARSILMTGQTPWHNGLLGYSKRTAVHRKYEMPKMLKSAGYYTCGIGKMHWTPQRYKRGFHELYLDESGRIEDPDFINDYRVWFKEKTKDSLNADATGIGWNENRSDIYQLDESLHPTTWTGQKAVDFIKSYDKKNPMFLKVSFARPHSPYDPPKRYLEMYANTPIDAPAKGDWDKSFKDYNNTEGIKTSGVSKISGYDIAFGDMGDEFAIESKRHYYANITFVDDQIGHIIATLKEKAMYENTLIIYVSDHGDMLGDHYHWRKTYAYQGSANIPYILKLPSNKNYSIPLGAELDQVVELRDILPTFLDAAKISVPEDMDGKSLLNLVQEKNPEWREYLDLEHSQVYDKRNYWTALTDGQWKYIYFPYDGSEQLFNLNDDPQENHQLSNLKEYHDQLVEWRYRMGEHLKERGTEYVVDGVPVKRKDRLYSPNMPSREYGDYDKFMKNEGNK